MAPQHADPTDLLAGEEQDVQPRMPHIRRYLTELIGTFFLVFTVGCTVLLTSSLAPVAIGSVLMVMIFAGGHISGGHFNPAVTLGVWLRGRIGAEDVVPYWVAQLLGATVAAFAAAYVTGQRPSSPAVLDAGPSLLAEFLFTFALVWVVLNVATSKSHLGNGFYGLAIGFTVLAGAVAVGSVSGGAFNPAVGLGVALMGLVSWSSIWIYLLADLAGGAVAAIAFLVLNSDDR
ncbi:MAG: MIP/aquaporin family protein [Actinomycetales bacterium]